MPDQAATTMAEALGKGPALSATSDMPALTPAPAPEASAPTESEAPAPAGAQGELDVTPEGAETAAEPAKEGKPDQTPPWAKREITIERNKRREAEQRAEEAARRLDQALRALQTRTPQPEPAATETTEARPQRAQYDDPDRYDEALIAWSARESAKATLREDESRRSAQAQRDAEDSLRSTYRDRREKALAELPDFVEVAESPNLQITQAMAGAIMASTEGPKLAYHLGKNPTEAARIATLPPAMQLVEMGMLAATLKAQARPVSNAPEPHRPIGARASAEPKSPHEESMEEYAARRNREIREARIRH